MNKQQAIERLKGIVDFYKLNDENNYDYSDEVLISMRIALEEIERLNNIIEKAIDYIKKEITCYSDLEIDDLIDILQGSDKE